MKNLLLFDVLLLLLLRECATTKAYDADEDIACMKLCYGDTPLYQLEVGNNFKAYPVDPLRLLDQNYLRFMFCLFLLDSCKQSCGLDDHNETSD